MVVVERKKGPAAEKRILTALRIPPEALEEIDSRAAAFRLTRTEYMLRTALGEPLDPDSTDRRLAQHEERISRLEELAFGQ